MKTSAALGALFLLVLVGGFYYANPGTPPQVQVTPSVATSTDTGTGANATGTSGDTTGSNSGAGTSGYTMAQVATHNGASSCWTAIGGDVYDLTSWISQHPGGEQAILSICGRDGTAAFESMHGRDPRAQSILASFKLGSLAS